MNLQTFLYGVQLLVTINYYRTAERFDEQASAAAAAYILYINTQVNAMSCNVKKFFGQEVRQSA
jgi:hypothetical protein